MGILWFVGGEDIGVQRAATSTLATDLSRDCACCIKLCKAAATSSTMDAFCWGGVLETADNLVELRDAVALHHRCLRDLPDVLVDRADRADDDRHPLNAVYPAYRRRVARVEAVVQALLRHLQPQL